MTVSASTCVACGAPIRWARTRANKAMPLDFDPNPAGNVVLTDGTADVLGPIELELADAGNRWMPHFATCEGWPRR